MLNGSHEYIINMEYNLFALYLKKCEHKISMKYVKNII